MWGGDYNGGPGVFPQRIMGPRYDTNEIYVLDADDEDWTRYTMDTAMAPERRESPHFALDPFNNVIYMFGGRTIDE